MIPSPPMEWLEITYLLRMYLIRPHVLLSETLHRGREHGKCKRLRQSTLQDRPDQSQGLGGGREGYEEGAVAHTGANMGKTLHLLHISPAACL